MHRRPLLEALARHTPHDAEEAEMRDRMQAFVESTIDCFERSHLAGHVTGSAFIVSPTRDAVLLMHHRKLNRWLQPGGHCDGDPEFVAVTCREVLEETGLGLEPVSTDIYDVDIHWIPERKQVPGHWHYDVRLLFVADPATPLLINAESTALAWVPLQDLHAKNSDRSILRMAEKLAI
ncbi:MAG: NUDIX hydrolase [Bacteroidota bacterium]